MNKVFLESVRRKLEAILGARRFNGMPSRFDRSDVIQESLVQVWRYIDTHGMTESSVNTGWLRSVAAGHYCKMLRFHLAAKRNINTEAAGSHPDMCPAEESHVELSEQRELALRLVDVIECLDPLPRQVVVSRLFEDQPFSQIARDTGLSVYLVRKTFGQAIRHLKSSIQVCSPG